MEARLVQLWSPVCSDFREWSIVDADLYGLPLSQAVLDNTPADISILLTNSPTDISTPQSDITKFLTNLLSSGYWSIWKVHSVKVFDVTQNSTSDLEYGSQVAHVVLVRDKIEVASTPNTSDLTTYFTSR